MTQTTTAIVIGTAAGAALVCSTVAICMANSAKKQNNQMREALKARGIDLDAELAKPNNSNNANTAAPGQKNNSNNAPQS